MLEDVLVAVTEPVTVVQGEIDVVVMSRADIGETLVLQLDVAACAMTVRGGAVQGIVAQELAGVGSHQAIHPCLPPPRSDVLCQRGTGRLGVVRPMQVLQRDIMVEIQSLECLP